MNEDIEEIKQIIQDLELDVNLNLSDDLLIEKFEDQFHWHTVSRFQRLSEEFIEQFQDKVHWDCISSNQNLSEGFILKHWNKLDHQLIIENQKSLTPAFLCWLYRTYQEEEYNLLKYKNDDFKEYALKIEEEVKIVMIEII